MAHVSAVVLERKRLREAVDNWDVATAKQCLWLCSGVRLFDNNTRTH